MKISSITILSVFSFALLNACGDKAPTTSSSMASLAGALSSGSGGALLATRDARLMKQRHERIHSMLRQKLSGPSAMFASCGGAEDSVTQFDSGCTADCSGDFVTNLNIQITCTNLSDTAVCGGTTFTLTNFNYSSTFAMTNISGDNADITVSMDFDGVVTGGAFNSTSVDCKMGFSTDVAQGARSATTFDCDDVNYSCSVGGTPITCTELSSSASSANCGN